MATPPLYIVTTYPVRVSPGTRTLDLELRPALEEVIGRVAEGLLGIYREVSEEKEIRDTGDFIDTMATHETDDPLTRIVKSDVRYSGVIEDGWIWRARGQESYPGRHPAAATVERADEVIGPALDEILGRFVQ